MKHKTCTEYWLDPNALTFRGEFEEMYRDIEDPWGCEARRSSVNNRIFLELLAEFGPYQHVLDLGCGLGGMTALVKERFQSAEIIGIDVSETAIRKARALHPEVSFRCLNLVSESLAELAEKHDLVTMSEIIWYVLKDLERVFRKLADLMHPCGVLGVHQYFPFDQRFGREVINGLHGFDQFLASQTPFVSKHRVTSHSKEGVVLLSTYQLRNA